jgi:hypothetical protein
MRGDSLGPFYAIRASHARILPNPDGIAQVIVTLQASSIDAVSGGVYAHRADKRSLCLLMERVVVHRKWRLEKERTEKQPDLCLRRAAHQHHWGM